ncbi:helix-turn-helix domain-containing protein [Cerasicoccus fimbriatus]|uniref:helix-turn-helix domain-containing protein n=1 Tax=Cerasicoccus fimbriatus TaxID=3014554 RepID=UPI0022B30569|nr:helix-turn-helix domain-containing protein [Cerasicoccus sp. TK19100]
MPNIGDRLEEARKRQGVSIREASEATKIRGDLLLSLENNNFDFDLPDVYKRGFLKLYARYLKLDTDKIMADFEAAMLGRSKHKRSDSREFFGRMDLPERTTPLGSSESTPPFGDHEEPKNPESKPAERMEQQADTSLYWKVGIIFVAVFVIFSLLTLLVQSIFSSDPEETDPGTETTITDNSGGGPGNSAAANAPMNVVLIGLGDTSVVVNTVNGGERIREASGSLEAGEDIPFTANGPIMIVASNIENIAVRINGREYRADGMSGLGRWYFKETGPYNP